MSVKCVIVVGHTHQMHLMLECCCKVRQKCLQHEHWQGDECAVKGMDAVDYLMVSEEMKPAVLAVALMVHL